MTVDSQHTTKATNDSILIVLDRDDPTATLRAALQDYNPTETTFHLLMVVPTKSVEDRRRAFDEAGVPGQYTIGQAKQNAMQEAREVGREYLGLERDRFEATGAVGRHREQVPYIVDKHEFSTVYVPEQQRSIIQRFLLGGSAAERIARFLPNQVSVESVDVDDGQSGSELRRHLGVGSGDAKGQSN